MPEPEPGGYSRRMFGHGVVSGHTAAQTRGPIHADDVQGSQRATEAQHRSAAWFHFVPILLFDWINFFQETVFDE